MPKDFEAQKQKLTLDMKQEFEVQKDKMVDDVVAKATARLRELFPLTQLDKQLYISYLQISNFALDQ